MTLEHKRFLLFKKKKKLLSETKALITIKISLTEISELFFFPKIII